MSYAHSIVAHHQVTEVAFTNQEEIQSLRNAVVADVTRKVHRHQLEEVSSSTHRFQAEQQGRIEYWIHR